MMENVHDIVFLKYTNYIAEKISNYIVSTTKYGTMKSTKFPLVSIQLNNNLDKDNNSLYNIDYSENFYFTINIYTQDKKIENEMIASSVINNEIQKHTSNFFRELGFIKTLNQITPNLDNNILRRTMQFQCSINNRGNITRR